MPMLRGLIFKLHSVFGIFVKPLHGLAVNIHSLMQRIHHVLKLFLVYFTSFSVSGVVGTDHAFWN